MQRVDRGYLRATGHLLTPIAGRLYQGSPIVTMQLWHNDDDWSSDTKYRSSIPLATLLRLTHMHSSEVFFRGCTMQWPLMKVGIGFKLKRESECDVWACRGRDPKARAVRWAVLATSWVGYPSFQNYSNGSVHFEGQIIYAICLVLIVSIGILYILCELLKSIRKWSISKRHRLHHEDGMQQCY